MCTVCPVTALGPRILRGSRETWVWRPSAPCLPFPQGDVRGGVARRTGGGGGGLRNGLLRRRGEYCRRGSFLFFRLVPKFRTRTCGLSRLFPAEISPHPVCRAFVKGHGNGLQSGPQGKFFKTICDSKISAHRGGRFESNLLGCLKPPGRPSPEAYRWLGKDPGMAAKEGRFRKWAFAPRPLRSNFLRAQDRVDPRAPGEPVLSLVPPSCALCPLALLLPVLPHSLCHSPCVPMP